MYIIWFDVKIPENVLIFGMFQHLASYHSMESGENGLVAPFNSNSKTDIARSYFTMYNFDVFDM